MKKLMFAMVLLCVPALSSTFTQCPPVGSDTTGCQLLITVTQIDAFGTSTAFTVTQSTTDLGPFDNSEDTLIGIQNSSGGVLKAIPISSPGILAFEFDGDGACSGAYSPAPTAAQCGNSAQNPTGYGSFNTSFTSIAANFQSGTVNINPGIANGGAAWFDLEEAITASQIVVSGTPEPASWLMFGTGMLALFTIIRYRRAY